MSGHILAIDQGTTSSRAIVFDAGMKMISSAQEEIKQSYPQPGWVEHDPDEIWTTVVNTARQALGSANVPVTDIAAIGITNQRETTVVWERRSGRALYKAIVWQDRRTAEVCDSLKADGYEKLFNAKTGLLLDPYFSGTKLRWLLDNVEGLRDRAEAGEVCFGTVDSWLIFNLTSGRVHATDATNASRTLLFNITEGRWDEELLGLLRIPASMLPEVKDCADDFGVTDREIFGASIRILGVAGDQQAATIGNACFKPGMMKSTYGTGCFALLNTGQDCVASSNRMITTVAYRLAGKTTYALEGSIFIAGAAVQWLRDGLGLISHASESGALATRSDPSQQVYVVPAFTGLGAPYWDPEARGAIFGLTRNSGPAELTHAVLESVAYQTLDLLIAMRKDWGGHHIETVLRVDGGMASSDWTMQRVADVVGNLVDRSAVVETTALGAAWLAGSRAAVWPDQEQFGKAWACNRRFQPSMQETERQTKIAGWRNAVSRTLSGAQYGSPLA
ncbi:MULTISPECIES: glycerol kinase GlpK [unclassified Rhizobium]|uniref:glycerol kinase GlpK n=1 Tax=unclassified Rhizobium TaxID=2613769 RepID=UPI00160CD2E5|nr:MULTISPECIES: glycerol kinase GlpK [unclassified Rhizobium]MBB3542155.1 glycerol kinase [Rhizobium sp. BK399]MCS3740265.1 glycerol kinase [Rhizobium sp. BK661]MCS4094279.1 glycerol kinase [Rhizobium sp. BK176]